MTTFTSCLLWINILKTTTKTTKNWILHICFIHVITYFKRQLLNTFVWWTCGKITICSSIFSKQKAKFSWVYNLLKIIHLSLFSLKIPSFSISGLGAEPIWQMKQLNCADELQREPNICPHFSVACSWQTFMH